MYLSIVSPVYKAEKILPVLVQRLEAALSNFTDSFEIVLVDDGSPDQSWDVLAQLAQEKKYIKAIRLSRNFGQHNAIHAGLEAATGEWIVVMDCDLQDQPEEIEEMLSIAHNDVKSKLIKSIW